jgi:hypothetical protein
MPACARERQGPSNSAVHGPSRGQTSGGELMTSQLFTDVLIFDATGRAPFPGEVLVRGNRIAKVAEGAK